jgi:hypothetical protein
LTETGATAGKKILKYIFPKQFGLHNVFTNLTDRRETTHAFKDYTDREAEITASLKDKDQKAYRRLGKRILDLILKMQKAHQQISYHELIHYYCSNREGRSEKEVEMVNDEKETSKELTQKEISTISTRMSEDIQSMYKDEDLIRHHTPHHKVSLNGYITDSGHCICMCSYLESNS